MSEPRRIQRQRTKGWRMPDGAVYVGRPSKWGNPWRVTHEPLFGTYCWLVFAPDGSIRDRFAYREDAHEYAAERFHSYVGILIWRGDYPKVDDLHGRDLACWCPLDTPCHADVLLELANQ